MKKIGLLLLCISIFAGSYFLNFMVQEDTINFKKEIYLVGDEDGPGSDRLMPPILG